MTKFATQRRRARSAGAMLGEEVARVLDGIKTPGAPGPIRTALQTLTLPGKPRGSADTSAGGQTTELNLTVGHVGDVTLVGLGGEVFNEIGAAIKAGSPFPCTVVITHCNGTAGYVPTKDAYQDGGYEVESSPFAPGAADTVVKEAVRLLAELHTAKD